MNKTSCVKVWQQQRIERIKRDLTDEVTKAVTKGERSERFKRLKLQKVLRSQNLEAWAKKLRNLVFFL